MGFAGRGEERRAGHQRTFEKRLEVYALAAECAVFSELNCVDGAFEAQPRAPKHTCRAQSTPRTVRPCERGWWSRYVLHQWSQPVRRPLCLRILVENWLEHLGGWMTGSTAHAALEAMHPAREGAQPIKQYSSQICQARRVGSRGGNG